MKNEIRLIEAVDEEVGHAPERFPLWRRRADAAA
jgi:hypothetical protein